eukprot:Skav234349  [mRNA]  locus=scaffold1274:44908:49002:+ [translate_table: standard]
MAPVQGPRKKFRWYPESEIVEDTQMDPPADEEEHKEGPDENQDKQESKEQDNRGRSRSPQREPSKEGASTKVARKTATDAEPKAAIVVPDLDPFDEAINQGYVIHDQKGTGDCGFRSIAASIAYAADGQCLTEEQSRLQGAKLRASAVSHIRRNKDKFLRFFAKDADAGANAPAQLDAWLNKMGQPHSWIDGVALAAVAVRTGLPIVTWRKRGEGWFRATLYPPDFKDGVARGKKDATPVVLVLSNDHYRWVAPPAGVEIPINRLRESMLPPPNEFSGSAKRSAADRDSEATPSVHTLVQAASSSAVPSLHTLRPSAKKTKVTKSGGASSATPSVHTLARFKTSSGQSGRSTVRARASTADDFRVQKRQDLKVLEPSNARLLGDAGQHVWTCALCKGHTVFTAASRVKLREKRANHLAKRHPNHEPGQDTLRKQTSLVEPSERIPVANRGWNCPWCAKGLPHLPRYQKEISVKAHFAKEHPKRRRDPKAVRYENFKKDKEADPIFHRKFKELAVKLRQYHDNKRKDADSRGHQLVWFDIDWMQKHQVGSGERPWVWAGDFNQELSLSEPVPLLANRKGAKPLNGLVGFPTRWKGRSAVDHIYSNRIHLCSEVKPLRVKISDHKPLWFTARQPWFEDSARHVLPPRGKWKQPEALTLDERRKELELAWQNQSSDRKLDNLSSRMVDVEQEWNLFNDLLRDMFREVQGKHLGSKSEVPSGKGCEASVKLVAKRVRIDLGDMQSRKRRKWMARTTSFLCKLEEHPNFAKSPEYAALKRKLGNFSVPQLKSQLADCENVEKQYREAAQQARLDKWKLRMQTDYSARAKWLRNSEQAGVPTVQHGPQACHRNSEVFAAIRRRWEAVWEGARNTRPLPFLEKLQLLTDTCPRNSDHMDRPTEVEFIATGSPEVKRMLLGPSLSDIIGISQVLRMLSLSAKAPSRVRSLGSKAMGGSTQDLGASAEVSNARPWNQQTKDRTAHLLRESFRFKQ